MLSRTLRSLAVAVLAAAGGLVAPVVLAAPASAAGCSGTSGVTVVVDFHELGGGVQLGCAPSGGGKTAWANFEAAGFPLTSVQRQPSFVCRVKGVPSADPCVNAPPADAYWALYWSDGKNGSWSYATLGAGSLELPDGGYVAFAWQGSQAKNPPGTAPTPRTAAPSTPSPGSGSGSGSGSAGGSTGGGKGGSGGATPGPGSPAGESDNPTTGPSASPSPDASSAPGKRGRRPGRGEATDASATASPSPSASAETTDEAEPASATPEAADPADDEGGVPGWVTALVLALLAAAGAAAAVVRRRRGNTLP